MISHRIQHSLLANSTEGVYSKTITVVVGLRRLDWRRGLGAEHDFRDETDDGGRGLLHFPVGEYVALVVCEAAWLA